MRDLLHSSGRGLAYCMESGILRGCVAAFHRCTFPRPAVATLRMTPAKESRQRSAPPPEELAFALARRFGLIRSYFTRRSFLGASDDASQGVSTE
jgi:hypothetical protein